jgi:hypothetical protein
LIDKLTKAELLLPELIQAWLLMEKIPQVYNNVQPILLGLLHMSELTPEKIKSLLTTEWDRKRGASQKPQSQTKVANRISAVKQKGVTPTFHQQQQPSKASSSHQRAEPQAPQQEWKQRSKRGGVKNKKKTKKTDYKGKGKHCAHFADADSDSDHSGDRMFATLAIADKPSQPENPFSLLFNIIPAINEPEGSKGLPDTFKRMTAQGSGQYGPGPSKRAPQPHKQKELDPADAFSSRITDNTDLLGSDFPPLGLVPNQSSWPYPLPDGFSMELTSG